VFGGLGVGRSRPNVNDLFPNPVSNTTNVAYAGGGLLYSFHPNAGVFVDAKFLLLAGREEFGAMKPVRAGVIWRF
jgi:hypothetical protein